MVNESVLLLSERKPSLPDGFDYIDEFITAEEERRLISFIQSIRLRSFVFQGHEAKRKVASFGFNYNFDQRTLTAGDPIPVEFGPLISRVASTLLLADRSFAEVLVTEYPVGAVINWHRDAMPFEVIAGISLLSDCKFKLRPYKSEKRTRKETITLHAKRRSLYKMSGPARYDWQHATAPVKSVRYSITLRTLNQEKKMAS